MDSATAMWRSKVESLNANTGQPCILSIWEGNRQVIFTDCRSFGKVDEENGLAGVELPAHAVIWVPASWVSIPAEGVVA